VKIVYALEPAPYVQAKLRSNVGLNGFTGTHRLVIPCKLVGSRDDGKSCALCSIASAITKIIPHSWWRVFIPEMWPIDHNRWAVAVKDSLLGEDYLHYGGL